MIYVYQIYCLGNDKIYVGQTNNLAVRWSRHRWHLRNNTHSNPSLQNTYNKYGESSFRFEMINTVETREEATAIESYWINLYREYGACFNHLGISNITEMSKETKERIRAAKLGKNLTAEHRANISKSMMGRAVSHETRMKISNSEKSTKAKKRGYTC